MTAHPQWVRGAEFAGFYAADQNGHFADEGLRVTMLARSEQQADLIAPVLDENVTFGLSAGARLLSARSRQRPQDRYRY